MKKTLLVLMVLFSICSCLEKIQNPLVFDYKDRNIALNISFDEVNERKGVYYGDLSITNLSNVSIHSSDSDLKVCLEDKNNIYHVTLDTVASIIYSIPSKETHKYRVILKTDGELLTNSSTISVVNRLFDKSIPDLLESISKCE